MSLARWVRLARGGMVAAMAALVLGAFTAMPGTAVASTPRAMDAPSASPDTWVRCDECVYYRSYYDDLRYVAGDRCSVDGQNGLRSAYWRKFECRYTNNYYGADLFVLWNA
ncbi:hypothetical protein [Nonomuraea rhodomycinica]|uniref:Uncharacterized protein n=1 Tax=Nonomuraea rhodomycinica TaxID=1712872 RepID=A0A7Y6IMS3_9ACTN|nr:hypothetical protein [Nonomuraea rhodomycinica]NUW40628.1 hypothetical protein [Nonomuraea rhodomycinica]